ncbi:MAG: recombinase family protein [Pseudomonadota bacterium]
MTTVAIYARYSSDLQREASIEDQVRICRALAEKEGWTVANVYSDASISAASTLLRPGLQALMQDASFGKFDLVVAEALDRISRSQADIAQIFERFQFGGIGLQTLSEGRISELHIGLKGTMNALFLKDLADKTRRGLRGRVEQGKSGGGIVYGYDVVTSIGARGEVERGERSINEDQAAIVRRIFTDYATGISPAAIAKALNREGVAAPNGGSWGPSTLYGNRERGTGILNNELYIGRLIWNRLRYAKDPATGKRVSRLNPESEWLIRDVPELRIIDDALWERVKARQGEYNKADRPLHARNRPQYLLSHLVKCGCCGGGFAMHNKTHLSCSTAKNKGTCSNKRTIRREELEQKVLAALQTHLMNDDLTAEFCRAYTQRVNELRAAHNQARHKLERELAKLEREKAKIVKSITDGVPTELILDNAHYVNDRMKEVKRLLEDQPEERVIFHPNMATRYQREIRDLIETLNRPKSRAEAAMHLRGLIDKVTLTPCENEDRLIVDLHGDLAGILSVATSAERQRVEDGLSKLQPVQQEDPQSGGAPDDRHDSDEDITAQAAVVAGGRSRRDLFSSQVVVVAGVGFEPTTFRL